MEKVDKHISELLYQHDCVIVPEFGGFVANYCSAKIHPTQHTFTPPSKSIVFNSNLKNNDGLLANHIALAENTNYPEALKYIHHFVEHTHSQLRKGEKVKLDEVGTFSLDVERNIQFEPSTTNYLLQAFGLASFQSPAIKRDNISKRLEKEFKNRGVASSEKKKINIKKYVTLALAAPLIFGLVWVPWKADLFKNVNYSSLNPFTIKEVKLSKEKEPIKASPLPITKKGTDAPKPVTVEAPIENVVEPVKADTTAVVKETKTNLNFKFHLVVGCFQIESNAVNFVTTLAQQNITASIIGKNDKGLFVVSCGDFATSKEAVAQLGSIRKTQPSAWLYKN